MSTSPALERPLLRVSRPVSACSRCRNAKIKCDGRLPACTACERAGKENECSSANDQFAKGKERSYVGSLEGKAERLEKRLAELRRRKSSVIMQDANQIPPNFFNNLLPVIAPHPQVSRHGRQEQRKEVSSVDDLVADFGFLSVNATARDFHGFTESMSYPKLLLASASVAPISHPSAERFPPRYSATPLIQHYLDNIYILLPFMPETSLWSSVDRVYHNDGSNATPYDHWTVRMVLAIAAASLSQKKGDTYNLIAISHLSAALNYAESVLHPGSVIGIQALLLLVEYSMLDPEHFKSWFLIGMASRAMVDLGLHQDPCEKMQTNKAALDVRRQVFYCVHALDRWISMTHSRSFSFTDDSARVEYPSIPDFALSTRFGLENAQLFRQTLDPALNLFKIRQIQSTWYQELNQSSRIPNPNPERFIWSVCHEMLAWFQDIPGTTPQPLLNLFELELYYSYITACAPSCKIPSISDFNKILVFEYSIQYAEKLCFTIHAPRVHAFFTYYEVLRAHFVGKLFLDILWMSYDQILSSSTPKILSLSSESISPPPLPPGDRTNNATRATNCITSLMTVMEYSHQRWPDVTPSVRDAFEKESALMLGKLKFKQPQEISIPYKSQTSKSPTRRSKGSAETAPPHFTSSTVKKKRSSAEEPPPPYLSRDGSIFQPDPKREHVPTLQWHNSGVSDTSSTGIGFGYQEFGNM
ncbi:MAG: hypothetical protein M1834_005782 [Cirrosporium novae-zelandiae]|nr:MAG: hypothetical protein M1834_005782 [Cirrosporium novae-zelandiae]